MTKSDQELRDKLASKWTSGSNRHGLENIYASPNESFCAGWDAAMDQVCNGCINSAKEIDSRQAQVDQLRAELASAKQYDLTAAVLAKDLELQKERDHLRDKLRVYESEAKEHLPAILEALKERDQLREEVERLEKKDAELIRVLNEILGSNNQRNPHLGVAAGASLLKSDRDQLKAMAERLAEALEGIYKRHLWHPSMGECICDQHAFAAGLLAEWAEFQKGKTPVGAAKL